MASARTSLNKLLTELYNCEGSKGRAPLSSWDARCALRLDMYSSRHIHKHMYILAWILASLWKKINKYVCVCVFVGTCVNCLLLSFMAAAYQTRWRSHGKLKYYWKKQEGGGVVVVWFVQAYRCFCCCWENNMYYGSCFAILFIIWLSCFVDVSRNFNIIILNKFQGIIIVIIFFNM